MGISILEGYIVSRSEFYQTPSLPDKFIEYTLECKDEVILSAFISLSRSVAFTQSTGKASKRWAAVTTARHEETTVNSTRYVLEMRSWFHLLRDAPACAVFATLCSIILSVYYCFMVNDAGENHLWLILL